MRVALDKEGRSSPLSNFEADHGNKNHHRSMRT